MNLHQKENNKLSESDFTDGVPNLTNIGANTTGKISKIAWLNKQNCSINMGVISSR